MNPKTLGGAFLVVIVGLIVAVNIESIKSSTKEIGVREGASKVMAWGKNDHGQLAMKPEDPSLVAAHAISVPAPVSEIVSGRAFTAALTNDGRVYSWGENDAGQLARGIVKTFDDKVRKIPIDGVAHIAATNNHILFLKNDGTVWSAGSNFTGQLGIGNNSDSRVPVELPLANIKKIAAGYKFSLALDGNGQVWAFGALCDAENQKKALDVIKQFASNLGSLEGGYYDPTSTGSGDYQETQDCFNEEGIGIKSNVPILIPGAENIVDISAGYGHGLLLTKEGRILSFGCNRYGQVGGKIQMNRPLTKGLVTVEELKDVVSISAGYRHSLALTKDGSVYIWGVSARVTPDNMSFNSIAPQKVAIEGVSTVSAGLDYSLFIKKDSTLWGQGMDNFRLLGDKDVTFYGAPVKVSHAEKVHAVSAGGAHIAVILE
jgi:alpha-tubulin suppressor-like RCC1 family protein